jgi:thioredoxin reductase (NADPH)
MDPLDCVVIGAGPAGLTAGIYLARFRRNFRVIDGGASRARWIPVSHNHPGFPDGVSGHDLLHRLRVQAGRYGAVIVDGTVTGLRRQADDGFEITLADQPPLRARRILLATGGEDVEPELPGLEAAVKNGLVRYCPICDAFEVTDRSIGLIGYGKCRIREALLLRAYTERLCVLTLGQALDLADDERRQLQDAGIAVIDEPIERLAMENGKIATLHMRGGTTHRFDSIYTALGTRIRSKLALDLGAAADEDGALIVDRHQQTSIAGLYAAGDVVAGLSQIGVAMGQAEIAANTINRSLPFPRKKRD